MAIQEGTTYSLLLRVYDNDTAKESTLTIKNANSEVTSTQVATFTNAYKQFYDSKKEIYKGYLQKQEIELVYGED